MGYSLPCCGRPAQWSTVPAASPRRECGEAAVPTRFPSDAELARLTGWPAEIADADLVTFFSPTSEDLRWPHEAHRGSDSRLGLSMQLCALPWLGWVPDDLTGCPPPAHCCRDTNDCGARRV
jgi:Domain of unknown function (DUF4158)